MRKGWIVVLVAVILTGIGLVAVGYQPTTSTAGDAGSTLTQTVATSPSTSASPTPTTIRSTSAPVPSAPSSSTAAVPQGSPTAIQPPEIAPTPAPDTLEPVPTPDGADSFQFVLHTAQVGDLPTSVSGATIENGAVMRPPEIDGCPWVDPNQVVASADIPQGCDWRETTIWPRASGFPASPSDATTFVVGHSCVLHLCVFSAVQRKPDGSYTVQPGDRATATTPAGVLTYQVCAVGSSPKYNPDGSDATRLVIPDCGGELVDLVLVTCQYDNGQSLDNIVVAMKLVASTRSS